MRLNNQRKKGMFRFGWTLVLLSLLGGVVAFFVERNIYHYVGSLVYLFLAVPVVLLTVLLLRGKPIFEYDSEGEALHFRNEHVIPVQKDVRDEFPKYKLVSYEVCNAVVFKWLYINISSKKNKTIVLKYDVSYLTEKEMNDLKFSLSKVIKLNKEREII